MHHHYINLRYVQSTNMTERLYYISPCEAFVCDSNKILRSTQYLMSLQLPFLQRFQQLPTCLSVKILRKLLICWAPFDVTDVWKIGIQALMRIPMHIEERVLLEIAVKVSHDLVVWAEAKSILESLRVWSIIQFLLVFSFCCSFGKKDV